MVTVTAFNGPITDLTIAEWLSSCEDAFENWEDENTGKTLPDKQKVHAAGNSISNTSVTAKLHSWWIENRKTLETKKWDDFRDLIKEKALGSGWRLRALKNLYTASQGSQTLDDYFSALSSMRFIISRSSHLSDKISDFEFKCHLLFQALPSLTTQVLKNDIRDLSFINGSVDDIKDYLRKYESSDATTSSAVPSAVNLSDLANAKMWIHGEVIGYGGNYGTYFTDMSKEPLPASNGLGQIRKVTVWSNNDSTAPVIQGYEMLFDNVTFKNPPTIYNGNLAQSLQFGSGEYISQIQVSYGGSVWGVCAIEITTSKGQTLFVGGGSSPSRGTFKAPLGWRIVGFYGMANYYYTNRYLMPRLGAICAPVV